MNKREVKKKKTMMYRKYNQRSLIGEGGSI